MMLRYLTALVILLGLVLIPSPYLAHGSKNPETVLPARGTFQHNKAITAPDGNSCEGFGWKVTANSRFLASAKSFYAGCADPNRQLRKVYLYDMAAAGWPFFAALEDANPPIITSFIYSVAMDEEHLAVTYYDPIMELSMASSYIAIYRYTADQKWELETRLLPPDTLADKGFGYQLAIEGNVLVVGAPYATVESKAYAGALYAYQFDGVSWNFRQKITDRSNINSSFYGWVFDLQSNELIAGFPDRNKVNVYSNSGGQWALTQVITASDSAMGDAFGQALAVDGDTLVVGADRDDLPGGTDQGSVYLFLRQNGSWVQNAKFQAPDSRSNDAFGGAVAIQGDTVAITAYRHLHYGLVPQGYGAVYIYNRSAGGWIPIAPSQEIFRSYTGTLGIGLLLKGNTLIAGSTTENVGSNQDQGVIHAYYRGVSFSTGRIQLYEGGDPIPFQVVLDSKPAGDVTITFQHDNPILSMEPSSIKFTIEDWNQPKQVLVSAFDNCTIDGYRDLGIKVSITSIDQNYNQMDIAPVQAWVTEKVEFYNPSPIIKEGESQENLLYMMEPPQDDVSIQVEVPTSLRIDPNPFKNSIDMPQAAYFSIVAEEESIHVGDRQEVARFHFSSTDPFYDKTTFCMQVTVLENDHILYLPMIIRGR